MSTSASKRKTTSKAKKEEDPLKVIESTVYSIAKEKIKERKQGGRRFQRPALKALDNVNTVCKATGGGVSVDLFKYYIAYIPEVPRINTDPFTLRSLTHLKKSCKATYKMLKEKRFNLDTDQRATLRKGIPTLNAIADIKNFFIFSTINTAVLNVDAAIELCLNLNHEHRWLMQQEGQCPQTALADMMLRYSSVVEPGRDFLLEKVSIKVSKKNKTYV